MVPIANATVAQAAGRQTVAAALQAACTEAPEHRAWINAINHAALNLEACTSAFDREVLRIASASSTARRTVGVDRCECKAAQGERPCWHRAAWRLHSRQ